MRQLLHCLLLVFWAQSGSAQARVKPGIEVLLSEQMALVQGKRIGLVTNHSGVDRDLRSSIDLLLTAKEVQLVALFSPEHGLSGQVQAGEKVGSSIDLKSGLPVYSLYGEKREPTREMLSGIDTILVDLQDAGTRYYTYPSTLMGVLRAAAREKISVIVLDRPNPLGGLFMEGPVLEPAYLSFVGSFAMPVRHGMTIGELARLFVAEQKLDVALTVVSMRGWQRRMLYRDTGLYWVPPSPNLPTPETALVYPGTALLEGTNISEGRGTANPFEQIGAPFVDGHVLAEKMNALGLPGVRFRPAAFMPTTSKFSGEACKGVMLHVHDAKRFRPVRTGVALVQILHQLYPAEFRFLEGAPPFFDRLAGTSNVRTAVINGEAVQHIAEEWTPATRDFAKLRRRYLLY